MSKGHDKIVRQQQTESRQQETPMPPSRGAGFSFTYEGPLLPQQLAEYDQTETGRQFLSVMMAQSQHRMHLERMVIEGDNRRADRGLNYALVISLSFLFSGVGVTLMGHDWVGGTAIISSISTLAGTFIYGTASRRQEREQKAKIMANPQNASTPAGQGESPPQLKGG